MSSRWRRCGVDNPCQCSLGGDDEAGMRVMRGPPLGVQTTLGLALFFGYRRAGTAGPSAALQALMRWAIEMISNSFSNTHGRQTETTMCGNSKSKSLPRRYRTPSSTQDFGSSLRGLKAPDSSRHSRFPMSLLRCHQLPTLSHCHTSPTLPTRSLFSAESGLHCHWIPSAAAVRFRVNRDGPAAQTRPKRRDAPWSEPSTPSNTGSLSHFGGAD